MKKFLAIILSMFLLFGVAAAEANIPETVEDLVAEEGAEIEFAYWEGSTAEQNAWNAVLDKFEAEHPEIKLTRTVYPSGTFRDLLDTRTAGLNGDWPDVIRYTYQRLGKFKAADVMLDMSPYITKADYEDFADGFISGCSYQGKVVALPHHTDVLALFYNKKMFEEQGFRIPTGIEDAYSWEEVAEMARKLKAAYNLPYGMGGIWENNSGYRYLPFVYMNGGALLSEDQTEITMDTPEVREALQWYADLRADDTVINTGFTAPMVANNTFVAQQIGIDFAGSWHMSTMQENLPDNWAITYMPQRNGKTGNDMGGNGLFCYKNTKFPKAAAILATYITSAEGMKLFCETGNFIPVRESIMGKLEYTNYADQMKMFNEMAATIDAKMAADETSVAFLQLNNIFNEEMDYLVVDGSSTVDDVIRNCTERMTEALSELE